MILSTTTLLFLIYAFLGLDILLFIFLLADRRHRHRVEHTRALLTDYILNVFPDLEEHDSLPLVDRHISLFIECFIQLHQSLAVDEALKLKLTDYLNWKGRDRYYLARLRSRHRLRRIEAATILGYLWGDTIQTALNDALASEKCYSVRIYLANALSDIGQEKAIPVLVQSLSGAPAWYQKKIHVLLAQFGYSFHEYIPRIIKDDAPEIQSLIISFASNYIADDLREYLLGKALEKNGAYSRMATESLAQLYPNLLDSVQFLEHTDPVIQGLAVRALEHTPSRETLDRLLTMTDDPILREHAVATASNILQKKSRYLAMISEQFQAESDAERKLALAQIMANRIEYFLANILSRNSDLIKELLAQVLLLHQTSSVIGFLNRNLDREVENEILSVVKIVIHQDEVLAKQFQLYLDDRLLRKLQQTRLMPEVSRRDEKRERVKLVWLYTLLVGSILIVPMIYLLRRWDMLAGVSLQQHLTQYVIDFNYLLGFYFGSVNSIYLLILFFSLLGVARQTRYWRVKKLTTLFKNRMLPPISIIAPAYCEEAGIIESTNSLLNLKYPDYELIVVNDGSSDQTL
ncbi:glycosyltransferase, partial [Candidatus Neomarinimicrobiota bacterium]